jgi:hypothetical protein
MPAAGTPPTADSPTRIGGPYRAVAAFYLLQALAVTAWWLALWQQPEWRAAFVPAHWPADALHCFLLPDAVLLVFGSAAAAWTLRRRHRAASALPWLVTGAAWYAALFCAAATFASDGQALAATLAMLVCALANTTCSLAVQRA